MPDKNTLIGSRYHPTHTDFRVWAANADGAEISYYRPSEAETRVAMTRESPGSEYWVASIPALPAGISYVYIFYKGADEFWRLDPGARDTRHSGIGADNGGVVVDSSYPWPAWTPPAFSDLIIYQLHVGSFAGMNDHLSSRAGSTARISDIETKLGYIRDLGFNAIELLPVQEFAFDNSWGYNPSFFYSMESAYGSPVDFRNFVASAHRAGLAVIFDVVYNHISSTDNSFWNWPVYRGDDRGDYLFPEFKTDWGPGPAFEKKAVRDFFICNAMMLFEEYQIDGLRLDHTRTVEGNRNGWGFLQELTWELRREFPDRYLTAEHLPDDVHIITGAGLHATWIADSHHEFQRASHGDDSIGRLKRIIGKSLGGDRTYPNQWNMVKYMLGSHDDCGDNKDGATQREGEDWKQHRYFVEFYGGRDNSWSRAKARIGWALNIASAGTPLMYMGLECHHPGYWTENPDGNGDHRFNWNFAGDAIGWQMRRLVQDANWVRWHNPCLRSETLDVVHEDYTNQVLAFKRYLPGGGNCVLTVINMGDANFMGFSYGVYTGGQFGQWSQILCTQDSRYGGWDGAGNAFHEPWTQSNGQIFINLPQWSVVMMRLR